MIKRLLASIRYKLIAIYRWNITIDKIQNWLWLRKSLFLLWWYDAPKYERQIKIGVYYLRKGTRYQVGQPFKIKQPSGKITTRYIDNLLFNFKTNEVNHRFSDKPIKGFSEPFIKEAEKRNTKNKK